MFLVKRSSMENACVFFGLGKVRWSSVQPHLARWVSTMDCAKSVRGMQVHKKREIYFYGIGIPCMNLRDYESFVSTMYVRSSLCKIAFNDTLVSLCLLLNALKCLFSRIDDHD